MKSFKVFINLVSNILVVILSVFRPVLKILFSIKKSIYSEWKRKEFKICPMGIVICPSITLKGAKYMVLGKNVSIFPDVEITTIDS